MADVLIDMLQGGHYSFLEELPDRYSPLQKEYEIVKEEPKLDYDP